MRNWLAARGSSCSCWVRTHQQSEYGIEAAGLAWPRAATGRPLQGGVE